MQLPVVSGDAKKNLQQQQILQFEMRKKKGSRLNTCSGISSSRFAWN